MIERVLGTRLRRLGPEEQVELIATASALPRGREHRQQRQPPAMVPVRAEDCRSIGTHERHRTERSQVIQRAGACRLIVPHPAKLPVRPPPGNASREVIMRIEAPAETLR